MATIDEAVRKAFSSGKEFYRGEKITSLSDYPCVKYSLTRNSDHEVDITFDFRKQRYGQKIISSASKCSKEISHEGYVITLKERKSNQIVMGLADIEKVMKILAEKSPESLC